jgi:hypothetical protein
VSDDLDAVLREMWPGLRPGERILDGERQYSAAWLDDRRLQAVPDKEQEMKRPEPPAPEPDYTRGRPYVAMYREGNTEPSRFCTPEDSALVTGKSAMPLPDALATLAETVGDAGRIDIHDLPIAFFGRDDIEDIDVLISEGRVHITGKLVIGGHKFMCFSKGFPMGAE